MDEVATKKTAPTTVFHPKALDKLRKELEQARRDAGSDPAIAKCLAFMELGLRWTEIEVRAHAFLTDLAKADKEAVKKTLDERFALMRQVFRETPLALNVACISWARTPCGHGWAGSGPGNRETRKPQHPGRGA